VKVIAFPMFAVVSAAYPPRAKVITKEGLLR